MRLPLALSATTGLFVLCGASFADVIELEAARDNTLYDHPTGALSNGSGGYVFAGRTLQGGPARRRALVYFDVAAALPAGSTIQSASLTMFMDQSVAGNVDISLHTVQADWGEAGSVATGGQGVGITAQPGDATWLHTFSNSTFWATPGGDYDPAASTTTTVNFGTSVFASVSVTADVQGWLDAPASNHGWLLRAVDEGPAPSAKRFHSRESRSVSDRPRLTIDFTPPSPGTTFCNSLPNATGSEALLTASGAPNSSLVLTSTPVPNATGQFFFGPTMLGGGGMLGDGIRCVGGSLTRILPFVSAGMMMQLPNTASLSINYTAPYAAGLTGTKYFQHWFRSTLATGSGSSTSSAIEITF